MLLKGVPRRVLEVMRTGRNQVWYGVQLSEFIPEFDARTMHTVVARLAAMGLIESYGWHQLEGTRGKGVKYYKITPLGLQVLASTEAVEENLKRNCQ